MVIIEHLLGVFCEVFGIFIQKCTFFLIAFVFNSVRFPELF